MASFMASPHAQSATEIGGQRPFTLTRKAESSIKPEFIEDAMISGFTPLPFRRRSIESNVIPTLAGYRLFRSRPSRLPEFCGGIW